MAMPESGSPTERVRAFLEAADCCARIVHTENTIFTVGDAARTVGAPPEKILKSLLFVTEEGEWALALMSGSNKVNDKHV